MRNSKSNSSCHPRAALAVHSPAYFDSFNLESNWVATIAMSHKAGHTINAIAQGTVRLHDSLKLRIFATSELKFVMILAKAACVM